MFITAHLRLLPLAPTAAPLLQSSHILVPLKIYLQNASKFATIQQISQTGLLRSKYTGTEADTHVVVVHFVLIFAQDHFTFHERH